MTNEHVGEGTPDTKLPAQRLCNEIQLFDLCDLEKCSFKDGRFCTSVDLLTAFERISDAEVVRREEFQTDELEEGDEAYGEEHDDAFDDETGDDADYGDDY